MVPVVMPTFPGSETYVFTCALVEVGERVSVGQELFCVETGKESSVVKSKVSGIIRRILVPEGEEITPGTVLAEIECDL